MGFRNFVSAVSLIALLFVPELSFAGLQFSYDSTDDGFGYILVSGDFEFRDDLSVFENLVKLRNPDAITFDSPGGNVSKAMDLGRLIRTYRLSTMQPRGLECVSACSLAFMGGVQRYAQPGAIGVHKSSFSGSWNMDVDTAVSAVQELTAEIIQYMIEMGVDPALLRLALKYESDDVRYLSKREMEAYKIITADLSSKEQGEPSLGGLAPERALPQQRSQIQIPMARTGLIRHPKGSVFLKSSPSAKAANLGRLSNGTPVQILGGQERWYLVSAPSGRGYLHHSWVRVDQYDHTPGLLRHIQIKSFDNYDDALAYARSSHIPLSVYLATNGWFAVTIAKPLDRTVALGLNAKLKKEGLIPDDSFVTFGNTYMLRACCDE